MHRQDFFCFVVAEKEKLQALDLRAEKLRELLDVCDSVSVVDHKNSSCLLRIGKLLRTSRFPICRCRSHMHCKKDFFAVFEPNSQIVLRPRINFIPLIAWSTRRIVHITSRWHHMAPKNIVFAQQSCDGITSKPSFDHEHTSTIFSWYSPPGKMCRLESFAAFTSLACLGSFFTSLFTTHHLQTSKTDTSSPSPSRSDSFVNVQWSDFVDQKRMFLEDSKHHWPCEASKSKWVNFAGSFFNARKFPAASPTAKDWSYGFFACLSVLCSSKSHNFGCILCQNCSTPSKKWLCRGVLQIVTRV